MTVVADHGSLNFAGHVWKIKQFKETAFDDSYTYKKNCEFVCKNDFTNLKRRVTWQSKYLLKDMSKRAKPRRP